MSDKEFGRFVEPGDHWDDIAADGPIPASVFFEKLGCPFKVHVVEPCKERKPKRIWLVAETGRWRGWVAQMLLRFSFWLGKFTYDNIEDMEN